ncbi:hypothetical protein H0O02_04390 [Candidatus Micrarchaeota archaeon]|nr:hypothetical protein [Candidatus Micrarchaeota archaeon]
MKLKGVAGKEIKKRENPQCSIFGKYVGAALLGAALLGCAGKKADVKSTADEPLKYGSVVIRDVEDGGVAEKKKDKKNANTDVTAKDVE